MALGLSDASMLRKYLQDHNDYKAIIVGLRFCRTGGVVASSPPIDSGHIFSLGSALCDLKAATDIAEQ